MGCLSLMSLRNPFAELVGLVLGKSDLQSLLCFLVFFIVSVVVAYLTNPSENSFRAYLTEQSFRHHLSRLDENLDDEQNDHTARYSNIYSGPSPRGSSQHGSEQNAAPFHFANRASISLRTPKHVFHSFAIFTIAAMVPVARASQSDDRNTWSISDSWYIGAFGKWWRGGVWETWYQDVIARAKDEESWSSGILNIKNLDMLQDFHAPSLSKSFPYLTTKNSPPKLRNRDRPSSKSQQRSGSPPPLSKSASLPLHTKRLPVALNDKSTDGLSQAWQSSRPALSEAPSRPSVATSIRPSTFENSPAISQILRQISVSETSVQDLHTQLRDVQFSASQSHDTLQQELDSCRERKRQEDVSRSELKLRTKTLDDSKRSAESIKRDVDRKLKAAQTTRDNARERINVLDKEIVSLIDQLDSDKSFLEQKSTRLSEDDLELSDALEVKKKEIKATEGLLAISNRKSRELEDTLSTERERLKQLKQRSQARRQELIQQQCESPPSSAFDDFTHSTQYAHFLDPYQAADSHDHSSLDQQHASRAVYGSRRSGSLKGSPFEEVESAYDYGYTGGPYGSEVGHISNGVYQISGEAASRRRAQNPLHDYLPYDGPAAVPSAWSLSSADELGYLNGHYKNGSYSNGQVKKGLNPDAKAFTLGRQITPPYDALNPNGLGISTTKSATSTTSSLLRAFAPSRAEREALQRALGGSTNSSLERLPSLSDVGSIPSSPSHVHASPTISLPQVNSTVDATKSLHLPSWFPTFLPRKSKFKPWDDDEPVNSETK
ncbi:hypothetical protein BKA70DRAFT_1217777 [Coprinopsis sp. MPI-PUGE-AT-0042]|nr:hypothetical protein BKA70DRAFT_1217777 [Coprinopsis sp. MPI-PUGE-AT-0042]